MRVKPVQQARGRRPRTFRLFRQPLRLAGCWVSLLQKEVSCSCFNQSDAGLLRAVISGPLTQSWSGPRGGGGCSCTAWRLGVVSLTPCGQARPRPPLDRRGLVVTSQAAHCRLYGQNWRKISGDSTRISRGCNPFPNPAWPYRNQVELAGLKGIRLLSPLILFACVGPL